MLFAFLELLCGITGAGDTRRSTRRTTKATITPINPPELLQAQDELLANFREAGIHQPCMFFGAEFDADQTARWTRLIPRRLCAALGVRFEGLMMLYRVHREIVMSVDSAVRKDISQAFDMMIAKNVHYKILPSLDEA